jgi:hypothetical protein
MDFRLPENRREAFIKYYVWQYRNNDIDTAIPVTNYLFERQEYNLEQRYYFCLLYGITYDAASAYAIFNYIPDLENIDLEDIKVWNRNNYKQIHHQSDVKWNRGKLDLIISSYKDLLAGRTQEQYFKDICNSDDPKVNYNKLKSELSNIRYFGRYVLFFYMQHLKYCCGLNIEPTSIQFGMNTQSPTDGLCYILDKPELASRIYIDNGTKKVKQSVKYTSAMIKWFDYETDSIINEIKLRFPDVKVDYFYVETALCSFKKLFRRKDGRYLGYYLARLLEDIDKSKTYFYGVDFNIIYDWMKECVPNGNTIVNEKIDKSRMNIFLDTGTLPELNQYKDLEI